MEIFDYIQLTGITPTTALTLQSQTLSADTIYLGGSDITTLSATSYQVKSDSTNNQIGFLDELVKDSIEVDSTDGFLHLLGDSATVGGNCYYGTNAVGSRGFYSINISGSSIGETNSGENIGLGAVDVYAGKNGVNLQFRTLSAGTGINILEETSAITISSLSNSAGGSENSIQINNGSGDFEGVSSFIYVIDGDGVGKLGVNNSNPLANLDVNGTAIIKNSLVLGSLTADTSHFDGYRGVFVDVSTGTLYANEPSTGTTISGLCNSVTAGTNLYTGGTQEEVVIGLNSNISLSSVAASVVSAVTFYSGSTNLETIIRQEVQQSTIYNYTPSSSGMTGTTGTVTWDENYLYVCINTNTWKRTALTSW